MTDTTFDDLAEEARADRLHDASYVIAGTKHCSFCDKVESEVATMISGPRVFICNECANIAHETATEIANKKV